MLIVFTGYLNDIEPPKPNTAEEDIKLSKTFSDFMKDNGEIAIMIQKGKGKLKWERDVPADIQVKVLIQFLKKYFFVNRLWRKTFNTGLNYNEKFFISRITISNFRCT